jgi:hypothetical protein
MGDVDEWLCYRVALLCANDRGRLVVGVRLRDRLARVGLFLDLVLRGRYQTDSDGAYLDTAVVGFAPADKLLHHVEQHPDRTLTDLFNSAPISMNDVLRALGLDQRPFRTVRVDRDQARQQREQLLAYSAEDALNNPLEATLICLAAATDLTAVDDLSSLFNQCGLARVVVADCCDYLVALMNHLALITTSPETSD